jgi:hypothetical protein
MTRSAFETITMSEGTSSKVCELTPSGIIPIKLIWSPPIFLTIFVIGETDVTTFNFLERASGASDALAAVVSTSLARGFVCFISPSLAM